MNHLFKSALVSSAVLCMLSWDSAEAAHKSGVATGRDAVATARHDWKATAHKTVSARVSNEGVGPVPANFGRLSPEDRLAYLLARREVNPARFDRYHPSLGPILARDALLRAAQPQACGSVGLLPDTAHNRYLAYRRSLNPARFDIYHPAIGALLVEDQRLRALPSTCTSTETLIPPPSTSSGNSDSGPAGGTPSSGTETGGEPGLLTGSGNPPSSVPEPASLALIALGTAAAGASGAFRRLRGSRSSHAQS